MILCVCFNGFLEIAGENAQRDAATGAAEGRGGNGGNREGEGRLILERSFDT